MSLLRVEVHAEHSIAAAALERFRDHPVTMNVTYLSGVLHDPAGDVVSCDIAREQADELLDELSELGACRGDSSVTVFEAGIAHVSERASRVERAARGAGSDALVWRVVRDRLDEEVELSVSFLAFMTLSMLLAIIGVLTDSVILVVGAMVLGPEFGPIASFCFSLLDRAWRAAAVAWLVVAAGFVVSMLIGAGILSVVKVLGVLPEELPDSGLVVAVASPGWLALVIALIAGTAGMLALTTARSASLVGVLISVTTIPAAADAVILSLYGDMTGAARAMATLVLNLTGLAASGIVTLQVQRRVARRVQGHGPRVADAV